MENEEEINESRVLILGLNCSLKVSTISSLKFTEMRTYLKCCTPKSSYNCCRNDFNCVKKRVHAFNPRDNFDKWLSK